MEIKSTALSIDQVNAILARALLLPGYAPHEEGRNFISLTLERLSPLYAYDLVPSSEIYLTFNGELDLRRFWESASELQSASVSAVAHLYFTSPDVGDIVPDGQNSTFELGFGLMKPGPGISIGLSGNSFLHRDPAFLAAFYNGFLREAGLEEDLVIEQTELGIDRTMPFRTRLGVRTLTESVRNRKEVPFWKQEGSCKEGMRYYWTSHYAGELFHYLCLYCFNLGELSEKVDRVIGYLGGADRIRESALSVFCASESYDAVRKVLEDLRAGTWQVRFSAMDAYSLSRLEDVVTADLDYVSLGGFTAGTDPEEELLVEVYYKKEAFYLRFVGGYWEKVTQVMLELAGGVDIIDHDQW